ncbi:MAG: TetR/AcrR family transcriptional regulator [Bacteroidales bacterium]|nr:TetR/AcrR family transcriptional regulator [Bacteroidales bacterium]
MDYRQRILEEAAEMFRTYGIRAVTMDMLASRMSISKRTIYEVFSDKEELLRGVLKWMLEKQTEVFFEYVNESKDIIEAIFRMLDLMFEHFQKMSPAFHLDMKRVKKDLGDYTDMIKELPYFSYNEEILNKGIKEGVFREDIDVEATGRLMTEVLKMSNDKDILPYDSSECINSVRNFYINFLRGISTQKGLDLINRYDARQKSTN